MTFRLCNSGRIVTQSRVLPGLKTKIIFPLLCLLLFSGTARAQFAVFDPSNLAQSIVNSTNEMVETSTTAQNMINSFKETVKIYEQSKKYYDKLKSVTDLVKDARKVQQCILMVGEISDIYVNSYNRMLTDKNFTPQELSSIAFGYARLLQESTYALRDLQDVTSPTDMSLTDRDRLDLIDRVHGTLMRYRNLTSYYTRKNISISLTRSREAADKQRTLSLYGNANEKYW